MKKLLVLLFSLLISFNSYGEVELDFSLDTFCDQSPKAQVRNGLFYLPNQQKPYSGENLCVYLSNGQYFSQGKIDDGIRTGDWTEWKENGQIKLERTYNFDQIVREKNYQNGVEMNDSSFSFNEKGQLEIKGHYKEGILVSQTDYYFYENGQKKSEHNFNKDGNRDGKETTWYENGQKWEEVDYKDGMKNGKWSVWYQSGQKHEEQNFKDDKKDGIYIRWYENGRKNVQGNFQDDKQDGKWIAWDNSGNRLEKVYKNGKCISGDCD